LLRGKDVHDIRELKRQGLSISDIHTLTGYDPKTIRKYLDNPQPPRYGPRQPRPSRLDPYKPYLQERMAAGVWNASVLLRELQERGYTGGYTILREFLQPLRNHARSVAVRRFETPPGQQAQVDWADLGEITQEDGTRQKLYGFVLTLGHSRALFADIATDQKLPTFLRLHEAAFEYLGGVPEEILYDNTKTVVLKTLTEGVDGRGEVRLNPTFADFARYWGFTPRLCRPYRPQTKGKVENGIGYVRKNFLCGRTASDLEDLRQQMRVWTATVANARVHGTTHRVVQQAWDEEKPVLQPGHNRRAYPLVVEVARRVSRDAYVCYQSNRYSVPWQQAGRHMLVREIGEQIEIVRDGHRLALHTRCTGRHQSVTVSAHHAGMPTSAPNGGKARLSLRVSAPEVEVRSLAVYAALETEVAA
jgi:transposase